MSRREHDVLVVGLDGFDRRAYDELAVGKTVSPLAREALEGFLAGLVDRPPYSDLLAPDHRKYRRSLPVERRCLR